MGQSPAVARPSLSHAGGGNEDHDLGALFGEGSLERFGTVPARKADCIEVIVEHADGPAPELLRSPCHVMPLFFSE